MATPVVLIVDDEEKNIKLLKGILSRESLDVITACNGEAALQNTTERIPDLILLDVMMPGMNGFDVCRTLKNQVHTQMIPVLMVTALKEKEDRIMALQAGADDFLNKPIDANELVVRVKSLLRIKGYYDALVAKNTELAEKNIEIAKKEQLKEALYHMVAHDLCNPLSAISGAVELLQMDSSALNQAQSDLLNLCLRGCWQLRYILDGIIDVYKFDQGAMQLQKEVFKWSALTELIEPYFIVLAREKNIRLDFALPDYECRICADRRILSRVVSNLIDNALRHTPAGGSVTVEAATDSGKRSLRIGVRDSGSGIPKEYLHKVFDRFAQLSGASNGSRVGSSGLGLNFCKMAVEAHNGRIWAESGGEGSGSVFFFELPM
jgi:signal transduction histidine kinase